MIRVVSQQEFHVPLIVESCGFCDGVWLTRLKLCLIPHAGVCWAMYCMSIQAWSGSHDVLPVSSQCLTFSSTSHAAILCDAYPALRPDS